MEKEQEYIAMENATVIFCDVVGFSKRNGAKQFQIINSLNKRVSRLLDQHLSYIGHSPNILYLPTGDGMAVVFLGPSRYPKDLPFSLLDNLVEWISEEEAELRIGIHHG